MTHSCPGCATVIPNNLFACFDCWALLKLETKSCVIFTAKLPLDEPARINARADATRELAQAIAYGRPKS